MAAGAEPLQSSPSPTLAIPDHIGVGGAATGRAPATAAGSTVQEKARQSRLQLPRWCLRKARVMSIQSSRNAAWGLTSDLLADSKQTYVIAAVRNATELGWTCGHTTLWWGGPTRADVALDLQRQVA